MIILQMNTLQYLKFDLSDNYIIMFELNMIYYFT